MNKLKFDGQVTDLFAEDFKYLQDNLESEVGKGLSQIIEDIPRAAVIKGFNPYITSYGGVSDTGIAVSHGLYSYSKGSIVTTDGLIYQTSTAFAAIPLPSYFEGHYYYICAVYSKVDGTYNKQTGVVDEGVARAIDYANYTLVYDREVDQCEILSYIDTDYVAITDFSKIVILGRVTVDSLGKIVSPIDETIRETILINIPDETTDISKNFEQHFFEKYEVKVYLRKYKLSRLQNLFN